MSVRILIGDCRESLAGLEAGSVQTCVTSPPYWGLRDYGHAGQLGMESTPQGYVDAMVQVFRGVRRALRDDGTLWVNLGDSYAAQRGGTSMPAETLAGGIGGKGDALAFRGRSTETLGGRQDESSPAFRANGVAHRNASAFGLKHKDLVGIPWRLAFALQADGWYLRKDVIWAKPNGMPESVKDRPTSSHEYVFLLSKSERYFYNSDAARTPPAPATETRLAQNIEAQEGSTRANGGAKSNGSMKAVSRSDKQRGHGRVHAGFNARWDAMEKSEQQSGGSNLRSVWWLAPAQYREAHFAVMPPSLAEICITAGSKAGDTILDPFGGAGTTGLVADRLNRSAILCELNPDYAELARKRIHSDNPLFTDVA